MQTGNGYFYLQRNNKRRKSRPDAKIKKVSQFFVRGVSLERSQDNGNSNAEKTALPSLLSYTKRKTYTLRHTLATQQKKKKTPKRQHTQPNPSATTERKRSTRCHVGSHFIVALKMKYDRYFSGWSCLGRITFCCNAWV